MRGLIHLYCGDGKGKTTAAAGMALRCAGSGGKVVFASFLKDGSSSEIGILNHTPGIRILYCGTSFGFIKDMGENTRNAARTAFRELFKSAAQEGKDADMLILDEICAACRYGFVEEKDLLDLLDDRERKAEVIMTGRDPLESMRERADYITMMVSVRHPFDRGTAARKGIEF